jgi:hypothetical protein
MKLQKKTTLEIYSLDQTGIRWAVALDGLVRFVGSAEQCKQRAEILASPSDRERQDKMLCRAL